MHNTKFILLGLALAGVLQGCVAPVAVGMGAGALMAADRRSSGAYIEDEAIENKAMSEITSKYKGQALHVNITSFNRRALVTGEVPSEAIRADVGQIVSATQNVVAINNELAVAGAASLTSRTSDTIITSDVKARFLGSKAFKANDVKVVTENGVVYLLGLVCRPEADAATEIASSTSGVERVVKVFEYIECPPQPTAKH
ncbi:MAG: BON domain-containing protein [Nitrosomonadales bacterium]|nr:BON domain-containing protein [Nitrosomonadales bacterium]